MTPDELKSIPKGHFVVMKTGTHPMQTRLRLFLEWGISFEKPYILDEKAARTVAYASKEELESAIRNCIPKQEMKPSPPPEPVAATQRSFHQGRRASRPQEERSDMRTKGE